MGTWFCGKAHGGRDEEAEGLAATSLNSSSLVYSKDMKDRERWRFPSFLQCISWNQRSWRKDYEAKAENNIHEDDLQDPEEEVPLTSLSPNGNCEEAAGGTGT
ncbi:hypothetical protein IHE44_0002002 [Lamprotornis superbus]|uniref:C2orf72-like C-terminal domain-containing protein n=1 Tax=Lamprotornis superbus TaxID=245042 RepID=A0A835TZF1_9PASS|nr:hypothetical protein IHE44_0002002 [Lamprotornis superbus]